MKKLRIVILSVIVVLCVLLCSSCAREDETGYGGEDVSIDYDYLDEYDSVSANDSKIVFRPPLSGRITSPFGSRIHPITGKESFHTGVDIGVKEGTKVAVTAGGVVKETGKNTAYGNFILVEHEDGICSFYGHCKEILADIGTVVRQGETIALSGNTGKYSTGPHLHFEIRINNEPVNPVDYVSLGQ